MKKIKGEIWKQIKKFPIYKVSNMGRVKSCDRIDSLNRFRNEKILKPWLVGKRGLISVSLYPNHTKKLVQMLVMEAFYGKRPNGKVCIHIDGIKSNCKFTNLKWVTESENNMVAQKQRRENEKNN